MLMQQSGFVCICPVKSVELGSDAKLHRSDHQAELHAELEFDCPRATTSTYAYMTGGGVRALNPNSSMTLAQSETCIAVFKGNLTNRELLAATLMSGGSTIKEAELLIQLYDAFGLDMLGRLDGAFAFCLYDSKQARVLAARGSCGGVPLVEGRTAQGSLIIACGTFMPEGVEDVKEIGAGQYKYGWHALPRDYQAGVSRQPTVRASLDHGIRRRSIDAYKPSVRQSLDGGMARYTPPSARRASETGGSSGTPHSARRASETGGSSGTPLSSHHHSSRPRRSMDVRSPYGSCPGHASHMHASRPGAAAAAAGGSSPYVPPSKQAAVAAAACAALPAKQGAQAPAADVHPKSAHQQAHRGADQQGRRAKQPAAAVADKLTISQPADCAGSPGSAGGAAASTHSPATPTSGATTPSSSKPNRRRHRRGRGHKGDAAGAAGGAGASHHGSSDTESSHSGSTASSAGAEGPRGNARQASHKHQPHHQPQQQKKDGGAAPAKRGPAAAMAAAVAAAAAPLVEVIKRNGSCSDLLSAAAKGASQLAGRQPTLQGMAC